MPIIQMIVIQIVIFALILYVLKKFVYKDITTVLQKLKQLQAENLQREEDLKVKMDEVKNEYEMKMLSGEEEINKIKDDTKIEARKIREEVLQNAKQEGDTILREALMKKDDVRLELELEQNEKSVFIAQKIIRALFSSGVVNEVHWQLINEAIEEITRLNLSQIKGQIEKVLIITPIPLSAKQRERLNNFIFTLISGKIPVQEEIDKTIIAGIVIKLDSTVLDASLNNRLSQISEALKEIKG
jgi:F-type H+-transporting ATPase subunit b